MDKLAKYLLSKVDGYLVGDLNRFSRFEYVGSTQIKADKTRRKREEFLKYLVSVATHPIGLRASVSPFNASQEFMLAYIVDMFGIDEVRLRKLLVGGKKAGDLVGNRSIVDSDRSMHSVVDPKKRHSWRPELRIRLEPPSFFYKESIYLQNLTVRVYIFKERVTTAPETNSTSTNDPVESVRKSRGVLGRIFKGSKLDSSILIRPVNELKCTVKFEPATGGDQTNRDPSSSQLGSIARHTHRMIEVIEGSKSEAHDDIHLNIRRYYCEPKSARILRFEFWLNTIGTQTNCLNRCRRFAKRFVYNGCYLTCIKRNNSVYRNEDQDFYGYVNIRLTQTPSYAIKRNFPVFSLHERKVNNCTIILEPKNRRIVEDEGQLEGKEPNRKLKFSFLVSHMRLYINCILYQFSTLAEPGNIQNMTLDNILYVAGFTLINQHRLQSNLNQFEDRCLRRASILILLTKVAPKDGLNSTTMALISAIQNEYSSSNGTLDERTMQEIDPFSDDFRDEARKIVVKLEVDTLRMFVDNCLTSRLERWLFSDEYWQPANKIDRSITLISLKLLKVAIYHFKKCRGGKGVMLEFLPQVQRLRDQLDKTLCKIVTNHLRYRIEKLLKTGEDQLGIKRERIRRKSTQQITHSNKWLVLLLEIKQIDQDLRLYWSQKGLDRLISDKQDNSNLFGKLDSHSFQSVIEAKMDNYLR